MRDMIDVTAGGVPLVEVTRGGIVESAHQGALVAVAADGTLLLAAGDPATTTYLRSCAKPFQALPFIEAGGAVRFGLDARDLALLCASHAGTDRHAAAIARLQEKTGVSESDLLCGTHAPFDDDTAFTLRRDGHAPGCNRHNCSGKHTGMVAYARMAHWPTGNYVAPAHPLQQQVLSLLAAMAGVDAQHVRVGIDGCSAPNFAIPLAAAALAWARFVDPHDQPATRASACHLLADAMMREPDMVSGDGRLDTLLMRTLPGRIIAKMGAEGCQVLAIPAGVVHRHGVGVFMKIADGDAENRARRVLTFAVLERLGLLDANSRPALAVLGPTLPIHNARGIHCGDVRPCPGIFPAALAPTTEHP